MLIALIIVGILLYVLLGNGQEWKWILTILGGALVLIAVYNLGWGAWRPYEGGYTGSCYSRTSGIWPVNIILAGVGLIMAAMIEWSRERPSRTGEPPLSGGGSLPKPNPVEKP